MTQKGRTRWVTLLWGMVLLAVLAGLYDASRGVDRGQTEEVDRLLNDIALLDGSLKRHLFRIHYTFEGSFDTITGLQQAIVADVDALDSRLSIIRDPLLHQELDALRETFSRQSALIEPLKSANALYRNALIYLPRAKAEFEPSVAGSPRDPAFHALIDDLMEHVFSGHESRKNSEHTAPADLLEALRRLLDEESEEAKTRGEAFIRHLDTIIEYRASTDVLLDLLTRSDQHFTAGVFNAYNQWAEGQAVRALKYRRLLFLAAFLLFLAAGVFFLKSRENAHELERAHDELKSRQGVLDEHAIVSITDRHGTIQFVNDKFCEISGFDREELIGQNHRVLKSGEHPAEFYTQLWRTVMQGGTWHGEICNLTKQGNRYWVYSTIRALFDERGQPYQIISIRTDLTYRRQIEFELQAHQEHLEQLVDARTAELHEAFELAQQASRAKSMFLANMSHEIRTPLNAILGMAAIMERTMDDQVQLERMQKLVTAARHLMALINDILDNARIESGRIELESLPLQVGALLDNVHSMIVTRVREKNLRFDVTLDPALEAMVLVGDPIRINQILINFLSNAVKFTSEGGITLSAKRVEDDEQAVTVLFSVSDTGIGIEQEAVARIFNPFEQAESSTSREYGGTGLGLPISRGLAALMNGECGVESAPGRGSTFWFTARLPKTDAQSLTQGQSSALLGRAGARILLVEDNAINREIARTLLEEADLLVDEAADGMEAIERLSATSYDLVLMDVRMPRMDGLEATRQIRASGSRVPIIALTANAFVEDREQCRLAGMDDFVAKPFEVDVLYRAVGRWVPEKRER